MRRSRRLLVLGVALFAATGLVLGGPPLGAGNGQNQELFEFTGGPQEFVVPADVCEVTVDAFGAQGGVGHDNDEGSGGLGGRATATIPVTPGETLQVNVGGQGEPAVGFNGTSAPGAGGFNGGAVGGNGGADDPGGGGGGASDVRQDGTGLGDRVVIAGGGGGSGGDDDDGTSGYGGGGGGLVGQDGFPSEDGTPGGGGGTQAGGGQGGQLGVASGQDGSPGQGGTGGNSDHQNDSGGGGGGGLFGGGGGAGNGFFITDDGGGGGGGSGFGPPGTVFETGVNAGHGEITISYTVDPGCAAAEPVRRAPTFTG